MKNKENKTTKLFLIVSRISIYIVDYFRHSAAPFFSIIGYVIFFIFAEYLNHNYHLFDLSHNYILIFPLVFIFNPIYFYNKIKYGSIWGAVLD